MSETEQKPQPGTLEDGLGVVKDGWFTELSTMWPGQGLSLARAVIVDRHGGQLTFDSTVGVGTTFYIRLPLRGVLGEVAA